MVLAVKSGATPWGRQVVGDTIEAKEKPRMTEATEVDMMEDEHMVAGDKVWKLPKDWTTVAPFRQKKEWQEETTKFVLALDAVYTSLEKDNPAFGAPASELAQIIMGGVEYQRSLLQALQLDEEYRKVLAMANSVWIKAVRAREEDEREEIRQEASVVRDKFIEFWEECLERLSFVCGLNFADPIKGFMECVFTLILTEKADAELNRRYGTRPDFQAYWAFYDSPSWQGDEEYKKAVATELWNNEAAGAKRIILRRLGSMYWIFPKAYSDLLNESDISPSDKRFWRNYPEQYGMAFLGFIKGCEKWGKKSFAEVAPYLDRPPSAAFPAEVAINRLREEASKNARTGRREIPESDLEAVRDAQADEPIEDSYLDTLPSSDLGRYDYELQKKEEYEEIGRGIGQFFDKAGLKPRERRAVELREGAQMHYDEIARELSSQFGKPMTPATARKHHSNAWEKISAYVKSLHK